MAARAASLAALVASGLYLWGALQYAVGTLRAPGAGLYPTAVGIFLVVTSGAIAVHTLVRRRGAALSVEVDEPMPGARGRFITAVAALVAFCGLLPVLGYPLVAFLFTTVLLQRLGGGRWSAAALGGLVTAAASHYLFAGLLGVPLPRGVF